MTEAFATGRKEIVEFGDALIQTRDLDPIYVGLVNAKFGDSQIRRWLLAYWCFYHCGLASYMSELEGQEYWDEMFLAADNKPHTCPVQTRWPRAPERRHFRGDACVEATEWLASEFPQPERAVDSLIGNDLTEVAVMQKVQTWPMFGPWIAFKVADMLERCLGVPIVFKPNTILLYDSPAKALRLLSDLAKAGEWVTTDPTLEGIYQNLLTAFSSRRAPPLGDRYCGPQEVETILCKWKSMKGGHYHIGKDIKDHRAALAEWGQAAWFMLQGMPQEV